MEYNATIKYHAPLSTVYTSKRLEQPKQLSARNWLNKLRCNSQRKTKRSLKRNEAAPLR